MELIFQPLGPFQTNCYVLINGDKAAVIDPGMGAMAWLPGLVEEKKVTITEVVLTHGHIDHTRDAGEVAAWAGVAVHLHPEDAFMVTEPGAGVSGQTGLMYKAAQMAPITDRVDLVEGTDIELAGVPAQVVHAPGHSPGSCMFILGDECVFSGDVLFKGSIGRTDLPGSSPEAMARSLKEKVLPLSDGLVVFPGHGEPTTMRAERRTNPFLNNPDAL